MPISDPRFYNLTEDFVFVDHDWGSFFYKYIGKMPKNEAQQNCSKYGNSVHLPTPRFADENEFYYRLFGGNLWLDLNYDADKNKFINLYGNPYITYIQTFDGDVEVFHYEWMNYSLSRNSSLNGVKMTELGHWESAEEFELMQSICIYDVLPDSKCSKCLNEVFCRFTDKERKESQCVCPKTNKGKFCEIDLCSHCENDGLCLISSETENQIENNNCICKSPFQGLNCQHGELI